MCKEVPRRSSFFFFLLIQKEEMLDSSSFSSHSFLLHLSLGAALVGTYISIIFNITLQKGYWASLISQLVKNLSAIQETPVRFQGRKIHWRRDRLSTTVFLGFCCGSAGEESTCDEGDLGLIPGLGRSSGEGKGYPLQYSGLENSMDCIVHGVAKSRTQLRDFQFHLVEGTGCCRK